MRARLVLPVQRMSLALGGLLQTGLRYLGANLPLFVCSLFAAIILTNTVPRILKTPWPAGTRSLALVSDVALGVFLAMSLMSLQLWTIVDVAGPIITILAGETILAVIFALFVIFRFHGPRLRSSRDLLGLRRNLAGRNTHGNG